MFSRFIVALVGLALLDMTAYETSADEPVMQRRMELMRKRVDMIRFESTATSIPGKLTDQPLFRYQAAERGYIDGAIWVLGGGTSRPLAIVTTELNPNFYDQGPKIIYEFLSLSEAPMKAESPDFPAWTPSASESAFTKYPKAGKPAETAQQRLQQMKAMAVRCRAWQVEGRAERKLRLLPEPILRYGDQEQNFDGGVFVYTSFTMPGLVLILESDGKSWRYGIGRLSRGTKLGVSIDRQTVWERNPIGRSWTNSFTSCNAAVEIPE